MTVEGWLQVLLLVQPPATAVGLTVAQWVLGGSAVAVSIGTEGQDTSAWVRTLPFIMTALAMPGDWGHSHLWSSTIAT